MARSRIPGKVDSRTVFASAFTPLSLSGCVFWGQMGFETGYSNNDPLTQITDWSGNGYHLTPYLGGDGGEWRTDGTFPYLQRGSSSSAYHNASFPAFGNNAFTLVTAAFHTSEFDRVPFAVGGGSDCHKSWAPTRAQVFLWCDDPFYTNAAADVPIVQTSTVENGEQVLYTQHEELGDFTFTDFNIQTGLWALDWFNNDRNFTGKLYGVNIYNRILSAPEIAQLNTYWLAQMPAS